MVVAVTRAIVIGDGCSARSICCIQSVSSDRYVLVPVELTKWIGSTVGASWTMSPHSTSSLHVTWVGLVLHEKFAKQVAWLCFWGVEDDLRSWLRRGVGVFSKSRAQQA